MTSYINPLASSPSQITTITISLFSTRRRDSYIMASLTSCFILLLVSATACAFPSVGATSGDDTVSISDLLMLARFEQWMTSYNRSYSTVGEKQHRFQVYKNNMLYIEASNSEPGLTYELGETQFTDLTNDEFLEMYTGCVPEPRASHQDEDEEDDMLITTRAGDITETKEKQESQRNLSAPDSIDWRRKRAVTPVKDQGQCGSCWAFSAVASIESLHKIKGGKLTPLSEKQLVDCDTGNGGCKGGDVKKAFDWVKSNGGITTEADYPYKARKDSCDKSKLKNHAAKITGSRRVTANSESLLMNAVARQPISVAIEASGDKFQHYKRGVYTGPCGTKLNHAVAVVGYGKDTKGTKYWIVKNSWGNKWGINGYIWMAKDVKNKEGLCGIAMEPVYPTM